MRGAGLDGGTERQGASRSRERGRARRAEHGGLQGRRRVFKCEVTYSADKAVAATVSAVAPALRMAVRISDRAGNRRLQKRDAVERSAEDLARVGAQVTAQDLLADGAAVDRVFEVACGVEAGHACRVSVEAALHRITDQKQRRG